MLVNILETSSTWGHVSLRKIFMNLYFHTAVQEDILENSHSSPVRFKQSSRDLYFLVILTKSANKTTSVTVVRYNRCFRVWDSLLKLFSGTAVLVLNLVCVLNHSLKRLRKMKRAPFVTRGTYMSQHPVQFAWN